MATKMKLRIRGTSFDPSQKVPRLTQRIFDFANALPDGDLVPTRDLAAELGIIVGSLDGHTAHPMLSDFKEPDLSNGHRNLWGNKASIAEFRFMKWYNTYDQGNGQKVPFEKLTDAELSKLRKLYGRTQNGKNKSK